jgi:hypothetical protein
VPTLVTVIEEVVVYRPFETMMVSPATALEIREFSSEMDETVYVEAGAKAVVRSKSAKIGNSDWPNKCGREKAQKSAKGLIPSLAAEQWRGIRTNAFKLVSLPYRIHRRYRTFVRSYRSSRIKNWHDSDKSAALVIEKAPLSSN